MFIIIGFIYFYNRNTSLKALSIDRIEYDKYVPIKRIAKLKMDLFIINRFKDINCINLLKMNNSNGNNINNNNKKD